MRNTKKIEGVIVNPELMTSKGINWLLKHLISENTSGYHSNPPSSEGLCSLPLLWTADSQSLKATGWCARFPQSLESSSASPICTELVLSSQNCALLPRRPGQFPTSPHVNELKRVKLTKWE